MTQDPTSAPPVDEPRVVAIVALPTAPDHRDMYLLILGLVIGLAASPWIMGRLLDEVAYNQWYYGGGKALQEYNEFLTDHGPQTKARDEALLDRLVSTGATKEAVDELRAKLFEEAAQERQPFTAAIMDERKLHEAWYRGLLAAIIVAMTALMFLEPLFESTGHWATVRRRLVTGRYGLLATWIALALAKPHMMSGISWLFALLAIVVIVTAAIIPAITAPASNEPVEEES